MSKFAKRVAQAPKPRSIAVVRAQSRQPSVVTSRVEVVRKASKTANTTNLAGGTSFKMSDKMEFVTAAFTGLLSSNRKGQRPYESEATRIARIQALIPKVGAEFAAKTALTLRIQHGQRSMSHLIAAALAPLASGETWAAPFYNQVVVRPDDMCEIAAAIWRFNGNKRKNQDTPGLVKMKLPNATKKGFAQAFGKFDPYRIAKYMNKSVAPNLRSLAMLVHPTPTNAQNALALKGLMAKTLVNTDTWEAKISAAGQTGGYSKAWTALVKEGKLGQLGLLKNLRNIADNCTTAVLNEALDQLRDAKAIYKNGILPAQYLKAYGVISGHQHEIAIKAAIDDAVEIAAGNVPEIGKNVLIAIDESGSMTPLERDAAAIFAATILKSNPSVDVMYFATSARYEKFNRNLPLLELMTDIRNRNKSGSTNFNAIFEKATKKYDTIVILSDSEGWMKPKLGAGSGAGAPTTTLRKYQRDYDIVPMIFSFDLGGDGSLMFREDSIITLAGSSFHVFKLLNILKNNREMLVDTIDKIEIGKRLPSLEEDDED